LWHCPHSRGVFSTSSWSLASSSFDVPRDKRSHYHTADRSDCPGAHTELSKPVFGFLCTLTTWHCPHSPAAAPCCCAARRPPLLIDISCTPGPQQQTRRTLLQRSKAGTDRQTDTVPFHRPCSAYYAGNANKGITQLLVCFVL